MCQNLERNQIKNRSKMSRKKQQVKCMSREDNLQVNGINVENQFENQIQNRSKMSSKK